MQWLTALFLTVFCQGQVSVFGQESVQDWSKKVIELQEKEGQNFEQDLQLVKGYLYLQRRSDALVLLNRLMKASGKKDPRLSELYETASDQFFFQETAESYAIVVQMIRDENWAEAREKVESALQKESRHRLLTLRSIQLAIILNHLEIPSELIKIADSNFTEHLTWKIYSAWINLSKNDPKEAYRIMSALWASDKKVFEKNEVMMLAFLQSIEQTKHFSAEWTTLSKIIQKHPEWVAVRLWRLKNKNYTASERKKEISQLKEFFYDMKKLKTLREKEAKDTSYFYYGLLPLEKTKAQFEDFIKSSEKDASQN